LALSNTKSVKTLFKTRLIQEKAVSFRFHSMAAEKTSGLSFPYFASPALSHPAAHLLLPLYRQMRV
jgi:hypothetical protein